MDKDTMQGFIQDIYESGKRDAEAHALDYDALREDLLTNPNMETS